MNHRPRKRFSQNFLDDPAMVAAIVAAIGAAPGDCVIEIGPGTGALTRPLLRAVRTMHAIEIDRDLAAQLETELAPALEVHTADALSIDLAVFGSDLRLVGNLPYNISTPLLFHMADYAERIRDIHVMLQKEVVERMVAVAGDSNYSRLSVMLQYWFAMERLLDVPACSFNPVPAVDSAVVRLTPHNPMPAVPRDYSVFAKLVTSAFSQRRKTLRNSLRAWTEAEDFSAAGIAPTARAQELSVRQFVALADRFVERGGRVP